jgi:hypothetical protein
VKSKGVGGTTSKKVSSALAGTTDTDIDPLTLFPATIQSWLQVLTLPFVILIHCIVGRNGRGGLELQ